MTSMLRSVAATRSCALAVGSALGLVVSPPLTSAQQAASHVHVPFPEALSAGQIEAWATNARLTPPQRDIFLARGHRVRTELIQLMERQWSAIQELSEQVLAGDGYQKDPAKLKQVEELWRRRNALAQQVARLEDTIFLAWSEPPVPTEEQIDELVTRQQLRRRQRAMAVRCEIPAAGVDLGEMIIVMVDAGRLSIPDVDSWPKRWRVFELELGTLRERHALERIDAIVEDAEDIHRYLPHDPESLLAARRQKCAPPVRTEKQILDRTRFWLKELTPLLDPPSRTAITDAYLSAAFPTIYPDPFSIRSLRQRLDRDDSIAEKPREAARAVFDACDASLADLGLQMERRRIEFDAENAETFTRAHARTERFENDFQQLNRRRAARAEMALAELRHLVGEHIDVWEETVALRKAIGATLELPALESTTPQRPPSGPSTAPGAGDRR